MVKQVGQQTSENATSSVTSPLPRVMHEAPAAILLVHLATSTVVYANASATAMSGSQSLPLPVDEWSRRAGLVDSGGQDLADTGGPLSAVARGEPTVGEMVRRVAARSQADHPAAAGDAPRRGVVDETVEPWWVTGFPLGPGSSRSAVAAAEAAAEEAAAQDADVPGLTGEKGGLAGTALLVFLRLDPARWKPRHGADADMHNRAVIATDLSFTISDPRQPDNPLVWVNPAFTRVTGYEPGDVVGRNCRFLQGRDTDPEALGRLRDGIRDRRPVTETLLNYRADGTAFWNEISVSPVVGSDGELVNYVGIQSDVTARMEAEEARAAAYAEAQQARARLAHLADVAEAVADLDSPRALGRLADVLVRDLVRWAVVVVVNGKLEATAAAGTDAPPEPDVHPAPRPGDTDTVARQLLGEVTDAVHLDLAESAPGSVTAWLEASACHVSPGRCMSIPIPGRRGVLGILVVGLRDGSVDDEDLALLRETSRRVGLSLENARLYAREHQLAETLQRSMLPEQSSVPGLDVWSYYAPNVEHAQVGGDWFDVMQPGADQVGVVVGDVVGHDIEAAAAMGQLRSVVRAYAFEQEEPGTVLMRVDQLVSGMRISRSASLVYLHLQRLDQGEWELTWARAGHLPPLLVRGGHVETLMEGGGPMVGVGDRARVTSARLLEPGDLVVCYTDGLIERRSRPMMDGLRQLQDVCGSLTTVDAAGVGEQLLSALGQEPEDDMAVVVLRVPKLLERPASVTGEPRQRRWQLPGESASIGRARRLTLQACTSWRLDVAGQAELVVSELVANAVLHGWGAVGLRLEHVGDALAIEVSDGNPRAPVPSDNADEVVVGGYGLHVVRRLADWGWHRSGPGKVVWARVPLPEAPDDDGADDASS